MRGKGGRMHSCRSDANIMPRCGKSMLAVPLKLIDCHAFFAFVTDCGDTVGSLLAASSDSSKRFRLPSLPPLRSADRLARRNDGRIFRQEPAPDFGPGGGDSPPGCA